MSTFTYEKIGQYGTEVVARIVADKGKVKGSDGKFYEIDISKNSTFDKFKQQVESGKFRILQDWLKSNQFEVLSPQNRSSKFEKLGWTEIEKTVFSSKWGKSFYSQGNGGYDKLTLENSPLKTNFNSVIKFDKLRENF